MRKHLHRLLILGTVLISGSHVQVASAAQGNKDQVAKLHVEKIVPHNDALITLNSSMINSNSEIEYIFESPIIKTYVMNTGINTLTIDNVMNGSIPSKLYMFFISQNAPSGKYNRNPLYLNHCSVNNKRLDVNGSVHSQFLGSFPIMLHNF